MALKLTVELTLEELREALARLPAPQLAELFKGLRDRAETEEMMKLAESAFSEEWSDSAEDIYL